MNNILINPDNIHPYSLTSELQLSPSNHEEFDSQVILHAANACEIVMKRIVIECNDTDVVVLAIFALNKLSAEKLWVSYGRLSNFKFIPIHDVYLKCRSQNVVLFQLSMI